MRIGTTMVALLLAATLVTTAEAQNVRSKAISGKKVAKNVASLAKLTWHKDFKALQAKAAKEKKVVFWLQVVGELDGGL